MAGSRAVASPVITFGLVSIPTKAYLAASSETNSFHMITTKGNRVKMKFVDALTNETVEKKDCSSGFEIEKDKYVVLTDEELKSFEGEKNNYIEIAEVVSSNNLLHTYIEKAYYLSPDKSDKAYKLLAYGLAKSNRIAIGKWQTRGRDHLISLVPSGGALMMFQMYYSSELREFAASFAKNSEPTPKEIELANMLLDRLESKHFDLSKYNDEYSARVKSAIEKKKNGESTESIKQEINESAFDLASLLESSLKKD